MGQVDPYDIRDAIYDGQVVRGAWGPYGPPTKEPPQVVRYRWSPSMHCWVEVVLSEKGYYSDGFTMPDGFGPPEGTR